MIDLMMLVIVEQQMWLTLAHIRALNYEIEQAQFSDAMTASHTFNAAMDQEARSRRAGERPADAPG